MALSKFLPNLDNAGRRLILAEILGEPVGIRLAKRARSLATKQSADQHRKHSDQTLNSSQVKSQTKSNTHYEGEG